MQGTVLYILCQPDPGQNLLITVQNYHHIPLGSTQQKKRAKKRARDRDKMGGLKKKLRKWCSCAFQRLFQSSVTRLNLLLIRQGHSPHIFQAPHCYQIQFHGQLLSGEVTLLPIKYISIYTQT